MTNSEFIKKYASDMIQSCIGTGLFPSVMMAQALLEGAAGKSTLAKVHHNHFGIKASFDWKGLTYHVNTNEQTAAGVVYTVKDYFKSYISDFEGFKDRTALLSKPRYKGVMLAGTAEGQCKELQKAGYATDVNYASKLIAILNSSAYNLKQYDQKKKS